jgi:hypothetical protein
VSFLGSAAAQGISALNWPWSCLLGGAVTLNRRYQPVYVSLPSSPVRPPSLIPTDDSATTVRGEVPISAPIRMQTPSIHRVIRRRGKRALSSMKPVWWRQQQEW